MITIKADFRLIGETTLVDAYDEIGAYVLWNGRTSVRPSYIGEGEVLPRFVAHLKDRWASRPLDGTIAIQIGRAHV